MIWACAFCGLFRSRGNPKESRHPFWCPDPSDHYAFGVQVRLYVQIPMARPSRQPLRLARPWARDAEPRPRSSERVPPTAFVPHCECADPGKWNQRLKPAVPRWFCFDQCVCVCFMYIYIYIYIQRNKCLAFSRVTKTKKEKKKNHAC